MPTYFDASLARWRYEFDRRIDGRRQRATKLLPKGWTRAQALAYGHEQDSRLFALATGAVKPRRLISEAVLLYLKQHAHALKSGHIIERELALCSGFYLGRHIDELAAVAREYATKHAGKLEPSTIRNRMAYLRAACRWAWKHHGIGEHDPAERMVMPRVRNEAQVYVTRTQVLQACRLISNLDARACALVAFYSGMRQAEVLRAKVTPAGWLLEDTKNGERRLVPIHAKVAHIARRWPRDIKAGTLYRRWVAAARSIGMDPRVTFHTLRHSTASEMLTAGADLYSIGQVLGHKSTQSTKRYAHLAPEAAAAALGRIGKRKAG